MHICAHKETDCKSPGWTKNIKISHCISFYFYRVKTNFDILNNMYFTLDIFLHIHTYIFYETLNLN